LAFFKKIQGSKDVKSTLQLTKATQDDKFFFTLFLVAVFGGAIRKWVLESPVAGNLVLLVQMVIPFLMFVMRSGKANSPFTYFKVLGLYFFYLLFQIINPLQLTLFHGVLGVMVYGLFWLGVFYYIANRHLFRPERYMKWLIVIVTIEVVLAFVQYTLPQTHVLNKYASDTIKQVATIADGVRVSGTFSYLSGYTAFLLFYPFFTWALIKLRYPTWMVAIAISFGAIAGFMTGSRSGMALYFAFTAGIVLDSYPVRELGSVIGRLILPVVILIAVAQLFQQAPLTKKINKAYTNFAERVTENRTRGEESKRLTGDFSYFSYSGRFKYPITGIGTGATYQGAIILFGTSPLARDFGYVESEFVKIILEGGLIILFLKLTLATVLVLSVSFTSKFLRLILWATLVYAAPIVFNIHNATFLMLGIMLADNIIWRQKQAALAATQKPVDGLETEAALPLPQVPEYFPGYPQNTARPV
jgi:hypothetical protein